jgi:hypothetical protein
MCSTRILICLVYTYFYLHSLCALCTSTMKVHICNNLIPRISAVCRCWIRQNHVPKHFWTCSNLYLHEMQIRSFVPKQQKHSTCPWHHVGWKKRAKNLERRINIKFCVKIGKSGSETLSKLSVLNGRGGSRKGKKMCKMTQGVGIQKRKGQMQMWTEYKLWCARIED